MQGAKYPENFRKQPRLYTRSKFAFDDYFVKHCAGTLLLLPTVVGEYGNARFARFGFFKTLGAFFLLPRNNAKYFLDVRDLCQWIISNGESCLTGIVLPVSGVTTSLDLIFKLSKSRIISAHSYLVQIFVLCTRPINFMAITVFKKIFPEPFSRLDGHVVIPENVTLFLVRKKNEDWE